MALKPLNVTTQADSAASTSTEIPLVQVPGRLVRDYNKAHAEEKAATDEKKRLTESVKETGLPILWEKILDNTGKPLSSVRLQDDTGATVMVTIQDRYSPVKEVDTVEAVFKALGSDINKSVQFAVSAKFDNEIFFNREGLPSSKGKEGRFNPKIYETYRRALEQATAALIQDGLLPAETPSPFNTEKVIVTVPGFHLSRWDEFPHEKDQAEIHAVIPCTVMLKPVIEKKADPTKK